LCTSDEKEVNESAKRSKKVTVQNEKKLMGSDYIDSGKKCGWVDVNWH
jgi:hypothetical protein